MSAATENLQDFGQLSRSEVEVLCGVATTLRPDERAGEGYLLSVEDGRHIWRFQRAGLTFTLRGDATNATAQDPCVVPARLLHEALYLSGAESEARLTCDGTILRYGHDLHRIEMEMGREAVPFTVPVPEFTTRATVSAADLFYSLFTTTSRPVTRDEEPLDEITQVTLVSVGDGCVWTEMDWRYAAAARSRSAIPAAVSGPAVWSALRLHALARVLGVMHDLEAPEDPVYGGDWTIAISADGPGWVRFACGDVELLAERSLYAAEAAIPMLAETLRTSLGVETAVADRTTIELEHLGVSVACEVFSGDDHRARFTAPVCDLTPGTPESRGAVLRELNAFNVSHLTCQAYVDDDTVYACHVMLLQAQTIDLASAAVDALVRDVPVLRECVRMAEMVGAT